MFQLENHTSAVAGLFQDWSSIRQQQTCVIKTSYQFNLEGELTPLLPPWPIQCGDHYFNNDVTQPLSLPDETGSCKNRPEIILTQKQYARAPFFARREIQYRTSDRKYLWHKKTWARRIPKRFDVRAATVFSGCNVIVLRRFYVESSELHLHCPYLEYKVEVKKSGKLAEVFSPVCDTLLLILDLQVLCFLHRCNIPCDFYDPEEGLLQIF